METSLKLQHANPLSLPELHLIQPCIIELVPILGHLFVNWNDIMEDLVGCPDWMPGTSSNGIMCQACSLSRIGPIIPLATSSGEHPARLPPWATGRVAWPRWALCWLSPGSSGTLGPTPACCFSGPLLACLSMALNGTRRHATWLLQQFPQTDA